MKQNKEQLKKEISSLSKKEFRLMVYFYIFVLLTIISFPYNILLGIILVVLSSFLYLYWKSVFDKMFYKSLVYMDKVN